MLLNTLKIINMLSIKLNCGRAVYIDAFYFANTYEGYLLGSPNEYMNKRIFEKITYPSNWGHREAIKIHPKNHEFLTKLKPFYFAVWIQSAPLNSDFDCSELVVIWLGDMNDNNSLRDIILTGIANIDWGKYAVDFIY